MKEKIIKDFLENLNFSEKSKLKEMLSHNITCYSDFAKENNIDVLEFNKHLLQESIKQLFFSTTFNPFNA